MNYNHMSGCGGVLIVRPSLGGQHPIYWEHSVLPRIAEVFFTRLFFTAGKQPFQLDNQGVNGGAIRFRLSLAGSISFHVLGVLFQPGLLAVLTQRAVERIFLQLFAMVIGAAATLAVTGAADHLVRMAARWLELLAAVWAFPDFEISWAHDCITSGVIDRPTWPTNPKIFKLARVLVDRSANTLLNTR